MWGAGAWSGEIEGREADTGELIYSLQESFVPQEQASGIENEVWGFTTGWGVPVAGVDILGDQETGSNREYDAFPQFCCVWFEFFWCGIE